MAYKHALFLCSLLACPLLRLIIAAAKSNTRQRHSCCHTCASYKKASSTAFTVHCDDSFLNDNIYQTGLDYDYFFGLFARKGCNDLFTCQRLLLYLFIIRLGGNNNLVFNFAVDLYG